MWFRKRKKQATEEENRETERMEKPVQKKEKKAWEISETGSTLDLDE